MYSPLADTIASRFRRAEPKLISLGWTSAQIGVLRRKSREYLGLVSRTERAAPAKKCFFFGLLYRGHNARFCWLAVALAESGRRHTYHSFYLDACAIDLMTPIPETVVVTVKQVRGKIRVLTESGPHRIARANILLVAMEAANICSERYDLARRGGGGERKLSEFVNKSWSEGFSEWSAPDATNYYLSLRIEHFEELPVHRRLIQHVAFLSSMAKIVIRCRKKLKSKLREWLAKQPGIGKYLLNVIPPEALTEIVARRGLTLGSALSPYLGRWFLSQALSKIDKANIRVACYADNIFVGGKSQPEVAATVVALKQALTHSAGNISLHDTDVANLRDIEMLGYRFQPGKGYDGIPVHVKPGPKRIERHKNTLTKILNQVKAQGGDAVERHELGMQYWRRWYNSQSGWTKVPYHSRVLSEAISASYISDFEMGIPMGTQKL